MGKRRYDNSARDVKRLETREAIIRVMVAAMAEGRDDMPVAEIAAAAGVSTRTVYVHFPDRASRIEGINDWIESRVDMAEVLPGSLDDLPEYAARLVDYVLDNESIIRVQMAPGLPTEVRRLRKQPHIAAVKETLAAAGWRPREASELAILVIATVRAEVIFDLRDTYGRSPRQIRQMMKRLVTGLLASDPTR